MTLLATAAFGLVVGTGSVAVTATSAGSAVTGPHHAPRVANRVQQRLVLPRTPAAKHLYLYPRVGAGATGELDCNGYSTVQKPVRHDGACTDIRGFTGISSPNLDNGRFYDNGHYIGHDEPDMTFLSSKSNSGNDVTWTERLPKDPTLLPTVKTPGKDVVHYFELTIAPWFSMDLCNGDSYPLIPCTPNSDANAPRCVNLGKTCPLNSYPGGGGSFLEMQFYPPGDAPFTDSVSCNGKQWCASLHINDAECSFGFISCNPACGEPSNFGFVQRNGVPTGPPSPQLSTNATFTPNSETLLMNPGDRLRIHISDAPAPAVPHAGIPPGMAIKVSIDDLTTGQSGSMQASAANGFAQTLPNNVVVTPSGSLTCVGQLFNYQPEYSTAGPAEVSPWTALQTNISTQFEIGHFEPCTRVDGKIPVPGGFLTGAGGAQDLIYNVCHGPYDPPNSDTGGPETGDAACYPKGDTHGTLKTPANQVEVAGCLANVFQNGDLDFDGTPYYANYPTGTSINSHSTLPTSFVQTMPTTGDSQYSRFFFQTDTALSESTCTPTGGCSIPPKGPGHFFPYWSLVPHAGKCSIEFGNVRTNADTFGKDAQYGSAQWKFDGFPEFEGPVYDNSCLPQRSQGYYLGARNGQVIAAGDAPALPSVHTPTAPIVGIASTPDGRGYFAVSNTGAVYAAGTAVFQGDLTTLSPPAKVSDIVALAVTTDGGGYWLIGADGGMFAFGDAKFHGSLPGHGVHVKNVVGMVATPSGAGYLIVGADGGVFAFGSARFFGSLPGIKVHVKDIRAVLPSSADTGYILVGADGGAFSFGKGVPFHGSLPGEGVKVSDVVGIALTSEDAGYWIAGSDGTVYPFGDARHLSGKLPATDLPISGISGVLTDQPNY